MWFFNQKKLEAQLIFLVQKTIFDRETVLGCTNVSIN